MNEMPKTSRLSHMEETSKNEDNNVIFLMKLQENHLDAFIIL